MHNIIAAAAGLVVAILAVLAIWRVTMRFSGTGALDNISVSRDWLVHHRDDNLS